MPQKHHSASTKQKIRLAQMGKKNSFLAENTAKKLARIFRKNFLAKIIQCMAKSIHRKPAENKPCASITLA
jgi:hypothetical protein